MQHAPTPPVGLLASVPSVRRSPSHQAVAPATSAPGLGSPLPHLRRDCSRPIVQASIRRTGDSCAVRGAVGCRRSLRWRSFGTLWQGCTAASSRSGCRTCCARCTVRGACVVLGPAPSHSLLLAPPPLVHEYRRACTRTTVHTHQQRARRRRMLAFTAARGGSIPPCECSAPAIAKGVPIPSAAGHRAALIGRAAP
jgi:hypothetical protein